MAEPSPAAGNASPAIRYCKAHPSVETGLSCGRCDTPICPRCMVMTPVGARCRDCARLRPLPTFDVRPRHYAAAIGAALAVAVLAGVLWSMFPARGFGALLPPILTGLAAGEAVARAVNRKRSRGLKAIAALAVVTAYCLSVWIPLFEFISARSSVLGASFMFEALARTAFTAAFLNPWLALALAFGAFVAASRIDR